MGFIVFVCGWVFLLVILYCMKSWFIFGAAVLATVAGLYDLFYHPKCLDKNTGNDLASCIDKDVQQDAVHNEDTKVIVYDEEDNAYDGFYVQREDEYRDEYEDDYEDAIQDEWEERKE